MEEFYFRRSHVPAFGSWDICNQDLPFTQCFESARQQAEALRYGYSEDRDLYVAGDLYENDVVTPAVIVVPRRRRGKVGEEKEKKLEDEWVACDCDCDCDCDCECECEANPAKVVVGKAVDEDLYKISPKLLRAHHTRKRGWGLLSSCLRPTCVC